MDNEGKSVSEVEKKFVHMIHKCILKISLIGIFTEGNVKHSLFIGAEEQPLVELGLYLAFHLPGCPVVLGCFQFVIFLF